MQKLTSHNNTLAASGQPLAEVKYSREEKPA
jgi:hypothetical protein